MKDLSVALGKTDRLSAEMSVWIPVIIIGLFQWGLDSSLDQTLRDDASLQGAPEFRNTKPIRIDGN